MLPILLNLGFIKIYTFGIFLVLAFFWSSFVLWKNIRLTSYKEEDVFDGVFISLGFALFLGRLIYVIFHFSQFGLDLFKFLLINGYPGFSLYGVLSGGILSFLLYFRLKKMKSLNVMDYMASPMLLGIAIGKAGSFFSGAEIGTKTKIMLALKYAGASGFRHLTPLYESLLFFLGSYISYRIMASIRRGSVTHGFNFLFSLWYFAGVYFLFDNMKQYRIMVGHLSLNWLISGAILLTTSFYFIYYGRSFIFATINKFISSTKKHGRQAHKKVSG